MTNTSALRPAWTPLTIGLMVLGFIVFWPLGLAMQDSGSCGHARRSRPARSGNVAFDDYRQQEIDRIEEKRRRLEEERKKLDAMEEEFDEFLRNLRRAKDQEEFDRFMADRNRPTAPDAA